MVALPRGIGLVRVDLPGKPMVVVSDHLTDREASIARALAFLLSKRGEHIVVLSVASIWEALAA